MRLHFPLLREMIECKFILQRCAKTTGSNIMDNTLNILVVDDEQIILNSISRHLKKDNYNIHLAHSARQAMTLMDSIKIDVVLTDLMMPGMDGLEFLKIIKTRLRHVPVIMITGYATVNTALKAMRLGAFDYIAKPFTKLELRTVVGHAVELVNAPKASSDVPSSEVSDQSIAPSNQSIRDALANVWTRLDDKGLVLMGMKHDFLNAVGNIKSLFLPSAGDEIRQGSVFLQIITTDLKSHTILSPLSGTVVRVNQKIFENTDPALEDLLKDEWLIVLKPSRFEFEIGDLEI